MAFDGVFQDMVRAQAAIAVEAAADGILELMQALVSVQHYNTGELYESIARDDTEEDGAVYHVRVHADVPYAEFVDEGTAPHTIEPQGNYPLRFFWDSGPNGAGTYYYRSVQHPGYFGSFWFSGSVLEWEDRLQSEFDSARAG